ncbi:MAG: hypothetical protein A2Y15_06665 [Clostridiales bacterium GWF2_36_10]|nr:MAG: hypothetical protein A2Y15_06665 [Clostridiales bacterium GWF2_36_10]HAN21232.1 hypothetical protein [Clostridiales bacterium]
MIILKSKYRKNELIARWDDRINPARFAGNDDILDLTFYGSRHKNNIKLIRRSGVARDPFSAIFRGKIISTPEGSAIKGIFTKSIFEYVITVLFLGFILFLYRVIKERGGSFSAINVLLVASLLMAFLFLFNRKATKRRYIDFLNDIL